MSLYRKYRPQTFEDVVGQDHVAQTLRHALAAEPIRVAHAYLFCGPRGTGKTTMARLLAKCLNCVNGPTDTPCNECDFCTRVRDNQPVMDLIEIDAASNTGVQNVRENIIEKVNVAPAQGRFRVYIIDEVHMLSDSSFNALLKTLEEPPAHAIFVLATTDAHKVLTTITSRCQRFDFRRVGPRDIVKRLQYVAASEGLDLADDAAAVLAQTADGALRDALTLLEQVAAFATSTIQVADVRLVLGTVSQDLLLEMVNSVVEGNAAAVLASIEGAVDEGASFSQLTRDLMAYTRELLRLCVGFDGQTTWTQAEKKIRHQQADAMGRERLLRALDNLRLTEKEMRQSSDHRLLLELALVRLAWDVRESTAVPPVLVPVAPSRAAPIAKPTPLQPATPLIREPVTEPPGAEALRDDRGVEPGASPPGSTAVTAQPVPTEPNRKNRRISTLDEFVELWPAVLSRLRKKISITAVAYLHDARPVALDEHQAVLEFKKEFHYAKASEESNRQAFEKVINEVMVTPHRLCFRLAAAPAPPPPAAAEPAPAEAEDDEEDIFQLAQNMFGAEVVGRSQSGG